MVGERIFESRKKKGLRGLTQDEFAEAIGKSLRTAQKYESGDIDIPLSVLYDISEALDVSVSSLTNCQYSHTKIDSLADVMAILIEISCKKELQFGIDVGERDGVRTVSLTFSGTEGYNPILCDFLETFMRNREALENGYINDETFNAWAESTITKNQTSFLNNIERDKTDGQISVKTADGTNAIENEPKPQKSQTKKAALKRTTKNNP